MEILVVEDNLASLNLVCQILEKLGHKPIPCKNGEVAWSQFKIFQPKICIIDWILPGVDGIELCRRISAWDGDHICQKIMLTSRNEKEDLVVAMQAGANDYLFKPVDINHLKLRLRIAELNISKMSNSQAT